MDEGLLAYAILWAAILVYFLLASLDFGSGFYTLLALRRRTGTVREAIRSFVDPRWEATNVFLVLIVVGAAAFFPGLVGVLGTVLLIPVTLVVILFVVRASFLIFDHFEGENAIFAVTYSVTGLLILPLLSVVLTLAVANPVTVVNGVPAFNIYAPLSDPLTYLTALLAFAGQILLSGLLQFSRDRRPEDRRLFRRPVYVSFGAVAVLGLAELVLLRGSSEYAFGNMIAYAPFMVLTGALFALAAYFLWRDRSRDARRAFALTLGVDSLALLTFAAAHYPYLFYPDITVDQALAAPAMMGPILLTLIIGLAIVIPSLFYLNYLFRTETPA